MRAYRKIDFGASSFFCFFFVRFSYYSYVEMGYVPTWKVQASNFFWRQSEIAPKLLRVFVIPFHTKSFQLFVQLFSHTKTFIFSPFYSPQTNFPKRNKKPYSWLYSWPFFIIPVKMRRSLGVGCCATEVVDALDCGDGRGDCWWDDEHWRRPRLKCITPIRLII